MADPLVKKTNCTCCTLDTRFEVCGKIEGIRISNRYTKLWQRLTSKYLAMLLYLHSSSCGKDNGVDYNSVLFSALSASVYISTHTMEKTTESTTIQCFQCSCICINSHCGIDNRIDYNSVLFQCFHCFRMYIDSHCGKDNRIDYNFSVTLTTWGFSGIWTICPGDIKCFQCHLGNENTVFELRFQINTG